jgi:Protein of unknown function (DUF1214)
LSVQFHPTGSSKQPAFFTGDIVLSVDGEMVGELKGIKVAGQYSAITGYGLQIGRNTATPVSHSYEVPFAFDGKLENVMIDIQPLTKKTMNAPARDRHVDWDRTHDLDRASRRTGGIHHEKTDVWSVGGVLADDAVEPARVNPIGRYKIGGDTHGLVTAPDGSITIRLQHAAPDGKAAATWLATPDGAFYLILRLYQPKVEILNGTYKLPQVVSEAAPEKARPK